MSSPTKKNPWLRRSIILVSGVILLLLAVLVFENFSGRNLSLVHLNLRIEDILKDPDITLPTAFDTEGEVEFFPEEVYVSGYFNAWEPRAQENRMTEISPGHWQTDVSFIPGENQYKFVLYDSDFIHPLWISDPTNQQLAPDGSGGFNSVFDLPDYESIFQTGLFSFMVIIGLYMVYLLIDGLSNVIFRTGLGQRAKIMVLIWFIVLLTFAINTIRSWDQQGQLIKTGLEDSINLVHRFLDGSSMDWIRIKEDDQVARFEQVGRSFFYQARSLVQENTFSNNQIRFDNVVLISEDLEILSFLERRESLPETNRDRQSLGFPRSIDYYQDIVFAPVLEEIRSGRIPLGKTAYSHVHPDLMERKELGYRWAAFLMGYDVFVKPIFQGTRIVGYYGVRIHPENISRPLQDIILYNLLMAILISIFLGLFFTMQGKNPSHDRYLLDRFIKRFKLSPREQEITRLLFLGYSNPEISRRLNISLGTVKTHIYHVFKKSSVNQRIELIQLIQDME